MDAGRDKEHGDMPGGGTARDRAGSAVLDDVSGSPSDLPAAIPAATLVILRDGADGAELLMVERAAKMAFAAGAMVFPGGRVDPADRTWGEQIAADTDCGDGEEVAARIAAIRETIEEAGLPIGLRDMPAPATTAHIRRALHAGEPFEAVLREAGVELDLSALVPFARWRPAHRHLRIFDTRFYLSQLPDDAPEASVDRTENVRLAWASAQGVLDAADAGRLSIIFPTRRNLERLARFPSFDEAAAHARATAQRVVTPWVERRDGEDWLCIPDDLGYPVTAERLDDASRG